MKECGREERVIDILEGELHLHSAPLNKGFAGDRYHPVPTLSTDALGTKAKKPDTKESGNKWLGVAELDQRVK